MEELDEQLGYELDEGRFRYFQVLYRGNASFWLRLRKITDMIYVEDYGQSYRGEEEFDYVAL